MPYWSWLESQEALISILTEHRDDDELLFTWPLLKDILPICDCIISGSKLQIAARVAQPHLLPSFAVAKRKIYLSATLLDDSQMAKELGVPVENILSQIKPDEFDDLGERLILVPADVDHELGSLFVRRVAKGSVKINRVVLVPTGKDAEPWQLAASYSYIRDKSKALSVQKKAYELNSALLLPPEGIQYHRMADRSETQTGAALRFLGEFDNSNSFVIHVNNVCDRLAFGVEAELFEQALHEAATIMGISSSRPEKTTGRGPDCLWLGDDGIFLIIEVKSEVLINRKELYKSETEQLIHSCEWFKQEYPGRIGRPLIIHPATKTAHEAVFPVEGRVLTPEGLDKLVASLRSFAAALAIQSASGLTEKMVHTQLELNRLLFDRCMSDAKKAT